jgi:hypothetical protein
MVLSIMLLRVVVPFYHCSTTADTTLKVLTTLEY